MLNKTPYSLPDGRRSLRKWTIRSSRCPSTDHANDALIAYGFRPVADFRRHEDDFQIDEPRDDTGAWTHCIYAFVIDDEILRIGSSEGALAKRLRGWSTDVSAAFKGRYGSTTQAEAELWAGELARRGSGVIWARQGSLFRSEISLSEMSAFREEEYHLIRKHHPRLNRSHR